MTTQPLKLIALALVLFLAGDARAQGDLDLLAASVPPNVMILFDNSGSMNHHLWDDDFDPSVIHPSWCGLLSQATGTITYSIGPGSSTWNLDLCGVTRTLYHDTSTSQSTRYDANYLNWLYGVATPAQLANEPDQTRLQAAKESITAVIDAVNPDDASDPLGYQERVRFGLAKFESGGDPDGGFVSVPIASDNKTAVKNGIDATVANTWTPLSETLVDVGRYFAGSNLLGSYDQYDRNTTDGDDTGSPPPSPIDVFCRKNFVVVVTDGEPTRDENDHHGSDFLTTIANADGDSSECSALVTACTDAPATGRDDGLTYASEGTDWLDDVAFYLRNTDLDPTLDETQNIITYTVGFTIDHPLLQETAFNGFGTYFTTSNADILAVQLAAALQDIIERSSSFAATTVPTSRTAFGDGFYTAYFVPDPTDGFWPGHLQAYRLSPDLEVLDKNGLPALDPTSGLFKEPRNPFWDAQDKLSSAGHPPRKLYTTLSDARVVFDTATVDEAELDLQASELTLYPNYPSVSFADTEALADALVEFLDGRDSFDKDIDGDTVEKREFVLGDMFHSDPTAVGPPSLFLSGEEAFGPPHDPSSFLGQYGQRDRKIYVGANDGMLHAFNSGGFNAGDNPATPETENGYYDLGDGDEAFGYVPGFLLDQLKYIPRNIPRQYYYVDGSPSAADVWLPSSPTDPSKETVEWATVLITGLRQGGSGYLALDITDPGASGGPHGPYPKLLWEFDETDAPIGETWSEPVITRVKLKAGSSDLCGLVTTDDGPCREQWVAIFGGGYREDGNPNTAGYVSDPTSAAWTDASKGVFMVAMDTGKVIGQVLFDSDPTAVTNAMRFSIASTPSVLDLDFDGFADVVYVGDLGGQMWRWDISRVGEETTPNDGVIDNWPVGLFFKSDPAALGAGGLHYHSIFFPPVATYLGGQLVLAFASGERTDPLYEGDPADDDNNRFWTVWDRVPLGLDPTDPNSGWLTLFEDHQTINGQLRGLNNVSDLTTDPEPADDGYYIVVPEGEKFITNHVLFSGILLTLTYVPDNSGTDICGATGETNIWVFHLEDSGGLLDATAPAGNDQRNLYLGPGAPTHPRIIITSYKVVLIGQTSLGNVFEFDVPAAPPPPVELIFWRQLF